MRVTRETAADDQKGPERDGVAVGTRAISATDVPEIDDLAGLMSYHTVATA